VVGEKNIQVSNPYPKRIFNILVLAGISFFLVKSLISGFRDLQNYQFQIDIGRLGVSTLAFTTMCLFQAATGVFIIRSMGQSVDFPNGIRNLLFSLMGKYIPGKIWVIIFRMQYISDENISKENIFSATVIEHFFLIGTAMIYGSTVMLFYNFHPIFLFVLIFSMVGTLFLVLNPSFIFKCINKLLIMFKRNELSSDTKVGTPFLILLLTSVTWSIFSIATWFAATSLVDINISYFFRIASAHALSVIGGFLVFFSPGGIGVREGIFVAVNPAESMAISVLLALLLRIIITVSEIIAFFLAHTFLIISRRENDKWTKL